MFLSSLSIKRPILVSMGLIVFLIFGGLAYFTLTLNLMPDVEIGYVTVQTIYPGAGPKEIESQVTKKIEDAVATISKIDEMRSFSMEGVSFVIIKFDLGKNADIANQEVKDKVNAILSQLPRDTKLPVVQKFDISAKPIIDVLLDGPYDLKVLHELAEKKVRDRLSQIEGVGRVNLSGGQAREIQVELENRTVFQNIISLQQLGQILAAQNLNIPGGHFTEGDQEYSIRTKGEFTTVEELKKLKIPTFFGPKELGKIASVKDASAEVRQRTTYFNNLDKKRHDNVVLLSLIKSSDGNTVKMADEVQKVLPVIEKELPAGCHLRTVMDKSIFIRSAVSDTLGNILLGVLLTGLVLLFFLHDLRSTIIVATAMPYSIISTFLFLQLSDFSLNIMTLMGLSTAVGILVTNSVVVIENIFRHKEMGHSRKEASDRGTSEIALAVIASTLTNLVVFLPIASMTSLVGQFFKEFALTVTYATIFSLIASFTVTPMLASLILPDKDVKKHPIGQRLESWFHSWENTYQRWIKSMLQSKKRSLAVVLGSVLLFILSLFVAKQVGFEFMPLLDEGDINIEVELPQGYNIDQTARLVNAIEDRITRHREVKQVLTTLGSISELDVATNLAIMRVKLVDAAQRTLSSNQMSNRFIKELSDIPNALIRVSPVSSIGSGQAPIQFYLMGQDVDVLERIKAQIVAKIKNIPGLENLNTSSRAGKPEITILPDRRKLTDAGLTVFDLAMTVRAAVEGLVTTRYREAGNEYDIRLKLKNGSINSAQKLEGLTVVSPKGRFRIGQLAQISLTEGYSKILHMDKYKSIEFSAYNGPGHPLGDIVNEINARTAEITMPPGYKISWGGSARMMSETAADMLRTFIIAFVLTYMLLAAILESLTQPLLILGTVPLALIGVFIALIATGQTMNTISMMAIVMLLGIVVNNAILLLDYANILRRRGLSVYDALVEACPTKLKPIIMATVAIILGMAPMALGIGEAGVEFRQPMGIVSIGGLVVSGVMTLFVIPALYHLTTKEQKQQTSDATNAVKG